MTAQVSDTRSADPIDAKGLDSAEPMPVQHSRTALAAPAPTRRRHRPTPGVAERVRAAASVMGWALWIMLALTMAAFLAFAPSLI